MPPLPKATEAEERTILICRGALKAAEREENVLWTFLAEALACRVGSN